MLKFCSFPTPPHPTPCRAVMMNLQNNSLSYNALEDFCNQTSIVTRVSADCGVVPDGLLLAETACPCCTTCCTDDQNGTSSCEVNLPNTCQVAKTSYDDAESGRLYLEERGVVCDCIADEGIRDGEGYRMSCNDTDCPVCNKDGTICALNTDYGFAFRTEDGFPTTWKTTFQYVLGRNDTVDFIMASKRTCEVYVNGEKCRDCSLRGCNDGFGPFHVSCDNIPGVGNIDLCEIRDDIEDSPLLVMAFQDEVYPQQGCPLLFGPDPHA